MANVTSDIHHVAYAYANPIVVSVSSATERAYTMLPQTDWHYSGTHKVHLNFVQLIFLYLRYMYVY